MSVPWAWADPDALVLFVEFYERHPDAPDRLIPYTAIVREPKPYLRDGGTDDSGYDCEFCKRDGTILYRDAGSGLIDGAAHVGKGGSWWARPGIPVRHHYPPDRRGKRLRTLPPEYRAWPFRDGSSIDDHADTFAWCDECGCLPALYGPAHDEELDDETPAECEERRRPCPHLRWGAEFEEWVWRWERVNACA